MYAPAAFIPLGTTVVLISLTTTTYDVRSSPSVAIQCIVCLSLSEQTATIYKYRVNWPIFITELRSVYCAVRFCVQVKLYVSFNVVLTVHRR